MTDTLEQLFIQFFNDLLDQQVDPQVTISDEQIEIDVQLDPNISGMVIGYKGEVLTSLQLVLALMAQKQLGEWRPVRVNVNDYRQQRMEALQNLAHNAADRAVSTGQPVALTHLSSYERRIVHSFLADNPQVSTHSEGEPPYRKLIITPLLSL